MPLFADWCDCEPAQDGRKRLLKFPSELGDERQLPAVFSICCALTTTTWNA